MNSFYNTKVIALKKTPKTEVTFPVYWTTTILQLWSKHKVLEAFFSTMTLNPLMLYLHMMQQNDFHNINDFFLVQQRDRHNGNVF